MYSYKAQLCSRQELDKMGRGDSDQVYVLHEHLINYI